MKLKHIRIALILIAVIILSVIAYRSYSAQTARTNLLTGTVEATRIDISAKESGTIGGDGGTSRGYSCTHPAQ